MRIKNYLRRNYESLIQADRDARYILLLLFYLPLLVLTSVQALNKGWFDSFERPLFHAVNNLPHFFHPIFLVITQLGSLGGLIIWLTVAYLLVNRRCVWMVAASGTFGWLVAKILKVIVHRGRPQDILGSVQLFQGHYGGFGFPSGHATFSAACATTLYYQIAPRYRKYLLWSVFLVGLSRMYLGAHFPLDVVGGWSLGVVIGAVLSLIFGNSRSSLRATYIKRILRKRDYELETVKFLQLDARGSRPLYIKDKQGNEYFAKLFGSQEHAADWLFKVYRLFRYKNLQAEEPYFNGRRNIEIESLANLWAKKAGVRVPEVIDFIKAGNYWLLVQQKIKGKSLNDMDHISTKALEDAWKQVKKLHAIPMAHRDLRAANILIDSKQQAWLIDFGFAETSPSKRRIYMDNAELLMSMALLVGVKRTVLAASKVLDKQELKSSLPYIQKSVFSGATRHDLRKNRQLLKELIEALKQKIGYKGEVEEVNIDRLSLSRFVNIMLFGLFVYLVLPQFREFRAAFVSVEDIRYVWLAIVGLLSLLTYISAAQVYVSLSNVPLKLKDAAVVQLAASFMTKIIPGGVGGTGLVARYLVKSGLDAAESTSVILVQNLIGFVMFIVPLLLLILFTGQGVHSSLLPHLSLRWLLVFVAGAFIFSAALYFVKRLRQKLLNFIARTLTQIKDISSSRDQLISGAAASLAITICYIGCLYGSAHAIHINLSLVDAAIVYAAAVIAKSVVPTPGGLGPLEVAMAASLVAVGIGHGQAIAVVIIYRLASFWLPIPFSFAAYKYAQAHKLI